MLLFDYPYYDFSLGSSFHVLSFIVKFTLYDFSFMEGLIQYMISLSTLIVFALSNTFLSIDDVHDICKIFATMKSSITIIY